MKVRFPCGTIRFGRYGATSDVPGEALADAIDGWDALPFRWSTPTPAGNPVPVEIACDYGRGFSWPGTAFHDRLVDTGLSFDGLDEVRAPHRPGLPEWWWDDVRASD